MKSSDRIHRAPLLEILEQRLLLSVDITAGFGAGGAATFTGDQTAGGDNDALVLSVSGGTIAHNLLAVGTLGYNSNIDFDPATAGDQTVAVGAANFTIDLLAGTNSVDLQDGGASFGTINWTNTGGTNTLTGDDFASTWVVSGADSGAMNTTYSFSGVGSLTGGTAADDFTLSGGTLSGTIDGGGGGGANSLTGDNVANTWGITGADAGTVTGVIGGFTNIGSLTGGTGNDGFTINSGATLSGSIDGGAGGTDALAQADGANTWTITGAAAGSVTDLGGTFANIDNLAGGTGADTFSLNDGITWAGGIDGGTGTDEIDWSAWSTDRTIAATNTGSSDGYQGTEASITGGFDNIEAFTGRTGGADAITYAALGGPVSVTLDVDATDIETLTGSASGADELVGTNGGDAWSITGAAAGSLNGAITFTAFENMTGGTGDDTFAVADTIVVAGGIDGGTGTDEIDWSAWSTARTVTVTATGTNDGYQGTEGSLTGGFDNIEAFTGSAPAGTDSITYAALAGPVSVTLGVDATNFETLTGSASGTDTLGGDNIVNAWSITGADQGTINTTINFSSFENLTGGTNDDTFTFQPGGSLSGLIDGNTHNTGDIADYSLLAGPLVVTFGTDVINIENLLLPAGGGHTLAGNDTVNTWTITDIPGGLAGIDEGTYFDGTSTTTFQGVSNLVGGNLADTFIFDDSGGTSDILTGSINGGGGANDTIVGDDLGNIFTVTGADVGTLTDTALNPKTTGWTAVENLTGGAVDDTFAFGAVGNLSGQINGQAETVADTVDYSAVAAPVVAVLGAAGATNIEKLIGDDTNDTLVGDNSVNDWNITQIAGGDGINEGTVRIDVGGPGQYDFTFDGFLNLTGGSDTDTFTFHDDGHLTGALDGAGGGDTVVGDDDGNAFGVTGANSGTLAGKTSGWNNIEIISGGAADDTFTFGNAGALTGSVIGGGDGAAGDTIIGDGDGNAFGITAANQGTLTGKASGWSGVENLTGGADDDTFTFGNAGTLSGNIDGAGDGALGDTLVGDNDGNAFDITGVNTGTLAVKLPTGTWNNVENLTGGNGTDTFTFHNAGSLAGAVDGGLGTDEIIGDNDGNTFGITGADSGTLAGKTSGWNSIENLTGGTNDDTFTVGAGGSLSGLIDGAAHTTPVPPGGDTLDYSAVGTAVTVIPGTGFTNIEQIIGNNVNHTLQGTNTANTWNITGVNAGTLNGVIVFQGFANLTGGTNTDAFNYENAGSLTGAIDGGTGNDTITGDDDGNAFTVTGVDTGTLAGKTTGWSGVENLAGGADDDTFTFTGAGMLNGAVDGGGDGAAGDTLVGDNDGNDFSISGADTGTLTGKMSTWSDIENLTGGDLDDMFTFGNNGSLSGLIDGGAHATGDEVDYSPVIAPVLSVVGTDVINVERVIGDNANDTFQGDDIVNTWVIDGGNTGTLNGVTRFVDMPNLTGGTNTDTFTFTNAGSLTGAVDGNAGDDTIVGDDDGNAFSVTGADAGTLAGKTATGFSNVENLTGGAADDTVTIGSGATLSGDIDGGGGTSTLIQADGNNAWNITGADTGTVTDLGGTWSNIDNLTGGTGDDTVTIGSGATLSGDIDGGGAGTDTLVQADGANAWTVTGADAGTVTDLAGTWSNIDNLTGGTGSDDFTINAGATLNGDIDGGAGANTLTQVDGTNAWNVTGADTGTVTDLGGTWSNIEDLFGGTGDDTFTFGSGATLSGDIDGGGGTDTLAQADGANTWTVTGADTGTVTDLAGTWSDIDNLAGGTGTDNFTINAGATLSGNIDGGFGNDTLTQADGVNAWGVDGADMGTVTDLGGTWGAIEDLFGGTGDDTFTFGAVGSLSGTIDGNGHTAGDTVDYSAVTAPVTAVSGTDFTEVEFIIGDGTNDTLAGADIATTWDITGVNDGTLTFAGPTVVTFTDMPNLTGGTNTDDFLFANAGSLTGAIDGGTGNDTIVGDDDGNAFSVTGAGAGTLTGKTATGFSNIENLTGGTGDDTFTFANAGSLAGAVDGAGDGAAGDTIVGDDDGNAFTIDNPDTGTLAGKTSGWSNVENLTGGTGDDDFTFGATGALTGIIDGAAHVGGDTVDYAAVTAAVVTVVDTDFTNVETVIGDGVNDTLVGADAVNAWVIDGVNTGTHNGGLRFTDIPNLAGGADDDTFTFTNAGSLDGALDGGGDGAGGDTIVGDDDGNAFTVTGANAGTLPAKITGGWSNVENLTGGAGDDGFTLAGGTLAGTIDGAGGTNTLTGDNVANTWVVTAAGGGTLTGTGGFAGIQNLVGGTAADTITLNDGGTITGTIDGGAGNDSVEVHGDAAAGDLILVDANGARLRVQRTNLFPFTLDIGTTETLIVSMGGGDDNISVRDLTGVADLTHVTVNGEAGDDWLTIAPSPTATILVDGGADSDTFVYVGTPDTAPSPDPDGVWTQAGFQDVTVQNCEWIGISNKIAELAAGQVIIYDADANNPAFSDVVTADIFIKTDAAGAVRSVTLVGNPSGLGLVVNSNSPDPVVIRDGRKPKWLGPHEDLAFVACMNDVRLVNLKNGITGYDVGSILLAEGLVADPDLDGDGTAADLTSLYAAGYLATTRLRGDVGSDVIARGVDPNGRSMRSVRMNGQLWGEITGPGDLHHITAIGGINGGTITTPGSVTGAVLSRGDVTNMTMEVGGNVRLVNVAGLTDQTTMNITGVTNAARLRGGMTNSTVNADGGLTRFQSGDMTNSIVNVNGYMTLYRSGDMTGSALNVAGNVLRSIIVGGTLGGCSAINITGDVNTAVAVHGPFDGLSTVTVDGNTSAFRNRGGMTDSTLNANGGLDRFYGGDITNGIVNVGGNMTVFRSGGTVTNLALGITGTAGRIAVGGLIDQSAVDVTGAAGSAVLRGGMTDSTLNANGGLDRFYGGDITNGIINVGGDMTVFRSGGTVTNLALGIAGTAGRIAVGGLIDQSAVDVTGAAGSAVLRGGMSDSTLNANGGLDRFYGGDITNGIVNVDGDVTVFRSGGTVTNLALGITGTAGRIAVGGLTNQTAIDVTGAAGSAVLRGGMTDSTLNANGGLDRFIGGDLTGSTINATGDMISYVSGDMEGTAFNLTGNILNRILLREDLDDGSAVNVTGNVPTFTILQTVDGGSTIDVNGNTTLFNVRNGIAGISAVNLAGDVMKVILNGNSRESSLGGGSTLILGNLGERLKLWGKLIGMIDIVGSAADATITIRGSITLGGWLTAGSFGDVVLNGSLVGNIGDGGTAAGVGNTLKVFYPNGGGTVTPADAFETYIGYTP